MARRHFLISYDISDDKRRTKVFNTLHDNGDWIQFSVFLCQLSATELARLHLTLQPMIHTVEDQILILDLGKVHYDKPLDVQTVGRPHTPPVRTMIV